jgi:hypothetical protein
MDVFGITGAVLGEWAWLFQPALSLPQFPQLYQSHALDFQGTCDWGHQGTTQSKPDLGVGILGVPKTCCFDLMKSTGHSSDKAQLPLGCLLKCWFLLPKTLQPRRPETDPGISILTRVQNFKQLSTGHLVGPVPMQSLPFSREVRARVTQLLTGWDVQNLPGEEIQPERGLSRPLQASPCARHCGTEIAGTTSALIQLSLHGGIGQVSRQGLVVLSMLGQGSLGSQRGLLTKGLGSRPGGAGHESGRANARDLTDIGIKRLAEPRKVKPSVWKEQGAVRLCASLFQESGVQSCPGGQPG